MAAKLMCGDVLDQLRLLPDTSVRCCVTSPPYWGLRDYGKEGQIGLEPTPDAFVQRLVGVFREVRRVLTDDGTLWLNLGDSYAANRSYQVTDQKHTDVGNTKGSKVPDGLKPKDLVGIPWMVAFALRADGWYLRRDIIWSKPNPMPESVRDRPTSAHEYIFLLSKSEKYYYDAEAIAEEASANVPWGSSSNGGTKIAKSRNDGDSGTLGKSPRKQDGHGPRHAGFNNRWVESGGSERLTRNARSVWTIATQPYAGAHFATFPEELPRRCLLAGSAPGDAVLDPFGGSGTTAAVAVGLGREAVHIDLNPDYIELAKQRIGPMLCAEVE